MDSRDAWAKRVERWKASGLSDSLILDRRRRAPKGFIWRDAIKTDPRYVQNTDAALASLENVIESDDDKVQHEHTRERAEIIGVLE